MKTIAIYAIQIQNEGETPQSIKLPDGRDFFIRVSEVNSLDFALDEQRLGEELINTWDVYDESDLQRVDGESLDEIAASFGPDFDEGDEP